jgi:ribosomal protein L33
MSFAKAEHNVLFDDLMKYTKMFVAENTNTDERFIPHAATWLNQRRYLDYKDKKNNPKKLSINNLAG